MKTKISVFMVLMLSVLLAGSAAAWAASPKLGYFDLETVLAKSTWGQRNRAEFKKQADKIKSRLEQKTKSFKALRDEYEKKKMIYDAATRKKKAEQLIQQQQAGEQFARESNAELSKLSNKLTQPIVKKILDIVKGIATRDRYDFIFEVQRSGIMYAADKYDLTQRIITELNKETPRK